MTTAQRQQRYRQRQKAGISIIPVPVDHELVEHLIEDGILDEKESADNRSVARSIVETLKSALGRKSSDGNSA